MKHTFSLTLAFLAFSGCVEVALPPTIETSSGDGTTTAENSTGANTASTQGPSTTEGGTSGTSTTAASSSSEGSTTSSSSDGSSGTTEDSTTGGQGSTGGPPIEPLLPDENCDPMTDVCVDNHACLYRQWLDGEMFVWEWTCQLHFTPFATYGDPCDDNSQCDPIGLCWTALTHAGCPGPGYCCTQWCHVSINDCPDNMDCNTPAVGGYTIPQDIGICYNT